MNDLPLADQIAHAARLIREGELAAFPTETVYGLGADATNPSAVAKIYAAKGRPSNNPLIVHVPDAVAARRIVREWPEIADRLANAFWPGGLTLVLPRNPSIPDIVTGGGDTVGVRVPAHPIALELLRQADRPIAAPSANRSLSLSPTLPEHVRKSLGDRAPFVIDGGPTSGGVESTVLFLNETPPRLLRPGLISVGQIESVIGPISRTELEASPVFLSPGLLRKHYSPNARLILSEGDGVTEIQALLELGERVGWLSLSSSPLVHPNLSVRQMSHNSLEFASRLFAVLHEMDAEEVSAIIVSKIPETDDWLTIRDRLSRAAM